MKVLAFRYPSLIRLIFSVCRLFLGSRGAVDPSLVVTGFFVSVFVTRSLFSTYNDTDCASWVRHDCYLDDYLQSLLRPSSQWGSK